jgi:hypothetical protein
MDDTFTGDVPYPYNVWGDWKTRGLPYGFYCRYVRDLAFRNVRVHWKDATGPWRSALRCEDVEGLDMAGVVTGPPWQGTDFPVVQLTDVRHALIRGCRLDSDADTCIRIDGARSAALALVSNDLSRARKPLAIDDAVLPDALFRQANRLSSP